MVVNTSLWLSQGKFWLLLILSIPSTMCSILILIYFHRRRRHISLHHHFILVLIITSVLHTIADVSFIMDYYQRGRVILASNAFCTFWNWWEYSSNIVLLFGMAWSSIERHLLVFNRTIMATKTKRLLFHVLPMFIACLYPLLFYFVAIVINSCENRWNYDEVFCQLPCYVTDQASVATYNFIVNIILPIFVIALANTCLILRVIRQHRRRHQTTWRRQRKLTRQLVCIAILYIVFWFPMAINGLTLTFIYSSALLYIQVNYFFFLLHMIPMILPFVSLYCLSDFLKTIFNGQKRAIVPLIR